MFSPDQAEVHVPPDDPAPTSLVPEPERTETAPPKSTDDGIEHPPLPAVSKNGGPVPVPGLGGDLSRDHENGVAANGMFAREEQSGNPESGDYLGSFEDAPMTRGDQASETAEQNTPEDSYAQGSCGIVLSDPVSMPVEESGFMPNPLSDSQAQFPDGNLQHNEPLPRNDEKAHSGDDDGLSLSPAENAAERLDLDGECERDEAPENPISEENSEILLSDPVSMAIEGASSILQQHESDDTGQSGSIADDAGCGLLLSDPISMSVDSRTESPTHVRDTDAQVADESPTLEISHITGSTRNCDVSSLLPAKFVSKCRENGVAKLLLECSKSSASFIPLSSLTDPVSVQSSAWEEAGGKSRVDCGRDCRAPARILVQLRLGYVPVADGNSPETPMGFDDAAMNICANHRQLLISAFPLDKHCGACRKAVDVATDADVHVISVPMSERFTRFLPDLVAGQPLCGACRKILLISIKSGKREYKTEASMANQLQKYQLLREENYVSVLDSCRARLWACLKQRQSEDDTKKSENARTFFPLEDWVIFNDGRAPFDTSASKVPPLR